MDRNKNGHQMVFITSSKPIIDLNSASVYWLWLHIKQQYEEDMKEEQCLLSDLYTLYILMKHISSAPFLHLSA